MNGLSLCAGIGSLDLAIEIAFPCYRCIAAVENNPQAARRFALRFPQARIFEDVLRFDAKPLHGLVDCIVAGWPCQPHSVAGKRRGTADERWIWDDIVRILDECGAPLFFGENVTGILRDAHGPTDSDEDVDEPANDAVGGMGTVLRDLASLGSVCVWGSLRAADVGAAHGRARTFFLAYRGEQGRQLLREALDYNRCDAPGHYVDRRNPNVVDDASGGLRIDGATPGSHGYALQPGERMANPESTRTEARPGLQRDRLPSLPTRSGDSGGTLADAELERRHPREASEPGSAGGPALADHTGGQLGDPGCVRWRAGIGATEERVGPDAQRRFRSDGADGDLADAGELAVAGKPGLEGPECLSVLKPGRRNQGRDERAIAELCGAPLENPARPPIQAGSGRSGWRRGVRGAGDELETDARAEYVAHTGHDGLHGWRSQAHEEGSPEQKDEAWRIASSRGLGLFAPGPSDPRWPELLRSRPDLAPALSPVTAALALAVSQGTLDFSEEIESGFHGLADGVARWLVERRPRLQSCGNGVVPLQAAAVFTVLARRLTR